MTNTKIVEAEKKPAVSPAKMTPIEKALEKTAEAAKKAEVKTATVTKEVKKEAEKTVKTVKPAVKKAAEKTTKKATEVKTAAKSAVAKVVKKPAKISIQFDGKDYSMEALEKIAADVWVYDFGKKASELKNVELYVKPEESKVYYVFNETETGFFEI